MSLCVTYCLWHRKNENTLNSESFSDNLQHSKITKTKQQKQDETNLSEAQYSSVNILTVA